MGIEGLVGLVFLAVMAALLIHLGYLLVRDARGRGPTPRVEETSEGRVYRIGETRVTYSLFLGVFAVLTLGLPLDAPFDRRAAAWVGWGVLNVVYVLTLIRVWRMAVVVAEDRVIIRNFVRTHVLPKQQVLAFQMGRRFLGTPIGVAKLDEGRSIRLDAIEPPNRMFRRKNRAAEQVLERLNADLAEDRGVGSPRPLADS